MIRNAVLGLLSATNHTVGLLHSLVVAHAEAWANLQGVETVYLLTTPAADFFTRLGYQVCERTQAPAVIRQTTQYAGVCPASAVLLCKRV